MRSRLVCTELCGIPVVGRAVAASGARATSVRICVTAYEVRGAS